MTAPVAAATSVNSSGANDPRARRGKKRKVQWKAYLYILPAFVLFAVFLGVPALQTAQYSLFRWNGIGPSTWVGLQNYADLFNDSVLRSSFLHSGVLVFFYSVIPVVLALFLTSIISRGANLKGMSLFRTSVVPAAGGRLGRGGHHLGRDLLAGRAEQPTAPPHRARLLDPSLAGRLRHRPTCGRDRRQLARHRTLPGAVPERGGEHPAGAVRGGPDRRRRAGGEFFSITLPALRGQIAVALTLTVVAALKTFDLVYVTTRGGPGTSTTLPAFEAYNRAFNTGKVGSAAAVAIVLTATHPDRHRC